MFVGKRAEGVCIGKSTDVVYMGGSADGCVLVGIVGCGFVFCLPSRDSGSLRDGSPG